VSSRCAFEFSCSLVSLAAHAVAQPRYMRPVSCRCRVASSWYRWYRALPTDPPRQSRGQLQIRRIVCTYCQSTG
jgi:hypothetical protein